MGLALAEELARRGGIEVQILERNSRIGNEASSAAAGILTPQAESLEGPGPLLNLLLAGYTLIPETVTRLQEMTKIDLDYRVPGMLTLAFTEADEEKLTHDLQWQQAAGLQVERLNATQVRKMEPAVSDKIRGGIYCSQAAQLDPRRLIRAYGLAVERQGVRSLLSTPADRFLVEKNRVIGVEFSDGKIYADWVVNCAGSWAGFDRSLPIPVPAIPARGQILQFSMEFPLVQRVVRSPRAYLVQRSQGSLIAGTTVEYVGFDKSVTEQATRTIREGACELVPSVGSIKGESAWAGLRPDTPDHLPILGPTPLEGYLVAAGHFRNGILLAPLTGRIIADLIFSGTSSMDLSAFSISRFVAKQVRGKIDQLPADGET